ncbi:MAG: hypothetical protein RR322_04190 [Oscillospiraceae bacterium]
MEIIVDFILKYWMQTLVAAITVSVVALFKQYKATQLGVQALLRSQLIVIYNKYIDKGWMPIYEKENVEHLYKEYKILKGNGVIDGLYEIMMKFPTAEGVE